MPPVLPLYQLLQLPLAPLPEVLQREQAHRLLFLHHLLQHVPQFLRAVLRVPLGWLHCLDVLRPAPDALLDAGHGLLRVVHLGQAQGCGQGPDGLGHGLLDGPLLAEGIVQVGLLAGQNLGASQAAVTLHCVALLNGLDLPLDGHELVLEFLVVLVDGGHLVVDLFVLGIDAGVPGGHLLHVHPQLSAGHHELLLLQLAAQLRLDPSLLSLDLGLALGLPFHWRKYLRKLVGRHCGGLEAFWQGGGRGHGLRRGVGVGGLGEGLGEVALFDEEVPELGLVGHELLLQVFEDDREDDPFGAEDLDLLVELVDVGQGLVVLDGQLVQVLLAPQDGLPGGLVLLLTLVDVLFLVQLPGQALQLLPHQGACAGLGVDAAGVLPGLVLDVVEVLHEPALLLLAELVLQLPQLLPVLPQPVLVLLEVLVGQFSELGHYYNRSILPGPRAAPLVGLRPHHLARARPLHPEPYRPPVALSVLLARQPRSRRLLPAHLLRVGLEWQPGSGPGQQERSTGLSVLGLGQQPPGRFVVTGPWAAAGLELDSGFVLGEGGGGGGLGSGPFVLGGKVVGGDVLEGVVERLVLADVLGEDVYLVGDGVLEASLYKLSHVILLIRPLEHLPDNNYNSNLNIRICLPHSLRVPLLPHTQQVERIQLY